PNTRICFSIFCYLLCRTCYLNLREYFRSRVYATRGSRRGQEIVPISIRGPRPLLSVLVAFDVHACSNAASYHIPTIRRTMKLFSVEEANALLPEIKRLWRKIDAARFTLRRLAPEAKRASEQTGGGGTPFGLEYINALTDLMASAQQIVDFGIEIKDMDKGLCDFPHLRDGRVVFLCWLKGEDRI